LKNPGYLTSGMGSSRTGLDREDTPRTKFCGLGLGLALGLETMRGLGFGFEEIWP